MLINLHSLLKIFNILGEKKKKEVTKIFIHTKLALQRGTYKTVSWEKWTGRGMEEADIFELGDREASLEKREYR